MSAPALVLSDVRAALQAKAQELASALSRDAILVEPTADELDSLRQAAERDLAVRSLNEGARLRRDILAALERVEDGSYGQCIQCEELIAPRRLKAMPWAARCLPCQEREELTAAPLHANETDSPEES